MAKIGPFVVLAIVVCACAPRPFKAPSVIAGSDRTVSIEAGQITDPRAFAEQYCARFGKRAIYIGATELSDTDLTNIYAYDCVDRR